nr:hypothetical protein Itr_chr02CG01850 [Ipomoea trifida]
MRNSDSPPPVVSTQSPATPPYSAPPASFVGAVLNITKNAKNTKKKKLVLESVSPFISGTGACAELFAVVSGRGSAFGGTTALLAAAGVFRIGDG